MKKCPYCAEDIQDEAIVCRFCNRELPNVVPAAHATALTSPFRVLKLIAIAIGLAFLLVVAAFVFSVFAPDSAVNRARQTIGDTPSTGPGVTLPNFNRLTDGMTYAEVVRILGSPGTEVSRSSLGNISTVMYSWQGSGMFGANMNAMFQNGRLVSKAQFGLK